MSDSLNHLVLFLTENNGHLTLEHDPSENRVVLSMCVGKWPKFHTTASAVTVDEVSRSQSAVSIKIGKMMAALTVKMARLDQP